MKSPNSMDQEWFHSFEICYKQFLKDKLSYAEKILSYFKAMNHVHCFLYILGSRHYTKASQQSSCISRHDTTIGKTRLKGLLILQNLANQAGKLGKFAKIVSSANSKGLVKCNRISQFSRVQSQNCEWLVEYY